MDGMIRIKSQADNRIRLKSSLFQTNRDIELILNSLQDVMIDLRVNLKCNSIILTHKKTVMVDDIVQKLYGAFESKVAKLSLSASQVICNSKFGCSSCEKRVNTQTFKGSLLEFGALSLFAGYIFVKEHILGVAIVASPFSLVAAVALFAAMPLLKETYEDIKQKKFTLQTFMGTTLLAAIFFGEATAAFEIIYILRGGMLLEEYIATKSKKEIENLVSLDMKKVYILQDEVEIEVDIDSIAKGDIVVARSGEKIPVDGIIVKGFAEIDESIINGRAEPEYKQMGDEVFAGTICEKGRIAIEVEGVGNTTYIARTMQQVQKSLANRSPSQIEADKLASKLLKLGTVLTIGTLVVTGSFVNAFAVMIVMSCPCATVLAASTAISAGIAKGAKNGVLIKGGNALEGVSQAKVFCFDKTGTLTTGKPLLSDILVFGAFDEKSLLQIAATAEYRNSHPIAKSIVATAKQKDIELSQCSLSGVIAGYGVEAMIEDQNYLIGNKKLLQRHNVDYSIYEPQVQNFLQEGKTVVFIVQNKTIIGLFVFVHEVRPKTQQMIVQLRQMGVEHMVLLTGDEERVAQGFAKEFDFDAIFANQSPQEKAAVIEQLKQKYGKVVMVGDGVNDTYAMSKADVAISFAAGGSEAAIAVSDIAITHSHPQDVVFLYQLSQKTLGVINQNYYLGTTTNLAGVALAAVGKLSPVAAGAIHVGHTVGIMANSSKLVYGK